MTHDELERLSMRELGQRAYNLGLTSIAHLHPEELIETILAQDELMMMTEQEAASI